MAIELQLKAILVAASKGNVLLETVNGKMEVVIDDKKELITDDGIDGKFAKHDLRELIRLINERRPNAIQVKGEKKLLDLLDKLQLIIEWGKYGFPKNPRDYRKLIDFAGGYEGLGGVGLSDGEIASCDDLYKNLESVYGSIMNYPPL